MRSAGGSWHTHLVPVKPPVVPVPAATLVLLRDRPAGGFEILLIKRHTASKFAAGDFVFPGGKVEAGDNPDGAAAWCTGLETDAAAERLGVDRGIAIAHWIGVIRETFEEVGILLAYDRSGRAVQVDDPRFAAYRTACQRDNRAFWTMVETERLTLATDRILYFAHWITPEENPLRFNTRFFCAPMISGQDAAADGREIVLVRWLAPRAALDAAARGEISLRNPTARNIELFDGAATAADAVKRLVGRTIPTIRPRVIMRGGVRHVLMPGDEGYF